VLFVILGAGWMMLGVAALGTERRLPA